MSSNFIPQQKHEPVDLTSNGWINLSTASHVSPEVFFRAQMNGDDKHISDCAQDQVMVEPSPGSSFIVIQAQIIFAALEVLLNVPTTPTQFQTKGFGRG